MTHSPTSDYSGFCAKRYLRWRRFFERCPSVRYLSQILVIFCKGICTGVRHMLTGVLIKRSIICCFSPKWTSFISELGAVTVDSGSQFLVVFTKSDQFHQRVRGGNCGSRVPKMDRFWTFMFLASIWRGQHLRRFAPLLCRVLSSLLIKLTAAELLLWIISYAEYWMREPIVHVDSPAFHI